MKQLVDIGVNFTNKSFHKDLAQAIDRANAANVSPIIVTGTSIGGSHKALSIAKKYPGLYSTAGVHPHSAKECNDDTIETLRKLASDKHVVAIGECGLDYNRDFSPRPVQDRWFEEQIKLACELKMPLFLHERDAYKRFVEILNIHSDLLPPVVVHCFTGSEEALDAYLEMGFYIGITGWVCDERRGKDLQRMVKKIPLERLMLETDSPFLMPRNISPRPKGRRNEPAFLTYVLEKIAECLDKDPEEVAEGTTKTAYTFFNLPED